MKRKLLITDCNVLEGKQRTGHPQVKSDDKVAAVRDKPYSPGDSTFSKYGKSRDLVEEAERSFEIGSGMLHPRSDADGSFHPDEVEFTGADIEKEKEETVENEIKIYEMEWDKVELRDAIRHNLYRITGTAPKQRLPKIGRERNIQSTSKERLYGIKNKRKLQPNSRVLLRQISQKSKDATLLDKDAKPYDSYIKELEKSDIMQRTFSNTLRKPIQLRVTELDAMRDTKTRSKSTAEEKSKTCQYFMRPVPSFTEQLARDMKKAYESKDNNDRMYTTRLHRLMKDITFSLNKGKL